jgi:hypothetical protein
MPIRLVRGGYFATSWYSVEGWGNGQTFDGQLEEFFGRGRWLRKDKVA